jgi:tetratricopeptide (TPR) repeat protein
VVLGLTVLASLLVYAPTANYGFVWDDHLLITGNQSFLTARPADLLLRSFWHGSPDPVEGPAAAYYRPLTSLSFWLDRTLWGLNPTGFHITNIILNALAAAAVTLVIWELLHSGVWALLGGLLFAVHSSHVESAAFVAGRTDLLAGLFVGLAAFGLLRYLRKHGRWWWLLAVGAYCLAVLSKETALLFPLLVVLAPLLLRRRYDRQYWVLVILAVAAAAGYLLLRSRVQPLALPPAGPVPFTQRLTDIANTVGLYLRMFFYPFEHRAKIPADSSFLVLTASTIYTLLFAVTIPLVALRRRFWVVLWGYAWVILFLLPVVNVVPIGPQAAERLLFLPSAGLVMILITLLSRLLAARAVLRQLAAVGLLCTATLLGADAVLRCRVWQSDSTLFAAMVREAPRAPSAYASLADAIAAEHPDSAIGLYNRTLTLDQSFIRAYINSAVLLSRKGDHRQAIHNLRVANELRPNSIQVLNNLGLAFLAAAQSESALAAIDRALAIEPGSAVLHLHRSAALTALRRPAAAESSLRRAFVLDSAMVPVRLALAGAYVEKSEPDSALRYLAGPAGRASEAASHLNRIGTMLVQARDTARARGCYEAAIAADSTSVPALFNLATLLAATGEPAAAVPYITRAHRLRPDLAAVSSLYEQLTGRQ